MASDQDLPDIRIDGDSLRRWLESNREQLRYGPYEEDGE